jgi:hypothetical protein
MYTSPLFKGAYQYAKKIAADKIFILSAKYGLLDETDFIEPYDETLNNKSNKDRIEWASNVLSTLSQKASLNSDEFVFLAGEKYRQHLIKYIANYTVPLKGLSIGKQLAFYKNMLDEPSLSNELSSLITPTKELKTRIVAKKLDNIDSTQLCMFELPNLCEQLHIIVRNAKRFDFNTGYADIPLNGIYVMFEKGEDAYGGERIVRIGTHTGDKQLKSRIYQHFENENKNRSIFRKNIGRCILNRDNNPYLSAWELDTTTKENKIKYLSLIDKPFEAEIEKQISCYIQQNLSFCVLDVPLKEDRLCYEARMIGTVSRCKACCPSNKWLGYHSPVEKIRKSGLWQVMELFKTPLSEKELDFISCALVKS